MKNPFRRNKDEKANQTETDRPMEATSFAQRVKQYFSTEPQKEKVLRHEDFNAAGDVYYASVSAAYKIAQRVLWLLFIFFLIFSIATNFREITYDNLFYLIKDFSSAADAENNNYETLSYESDSRQHFVLYRGGIATVSPSKMSIFTATGRRTLNSTSSFSSPYMVSSKKYVLVYDTSGKTFSVYNSFARVHTETLEYPVTNACFAEDGSFAIVTRSSDSRSIIYVYNKSFKRVAELRADYYVFDLVIHKERNCLAMLYYDEGNGTGRSTLSVRDLTTLEEVNCLQFDGEFSLACGFLENNRFALLTDRYIRIFDQDFDEKERSRDYSAGSITGYSLSEHGVGVSVTLSSKNLVIAFDKSGNLLYNDGVSFTISDISVYDSYIFLQTEQGVTRIDSKSEVQMHLDSGTGKMLIYNANTALVCGESKAEYLVFKD